jgi:hypothetical protein
MPPGKTMLGSPAELLGAIFRANAVRMGTMMPLISTLNPGDVGGLGIGGAGIRTTGAAQADFVAQVQGSLTPLWVAGNLGASLNAIIFAVGLVTSSHPTASLRRSVTAAECRSATTPASCPPVASPLAPTAAAQG